MLFPDRLKKIAALVTLSVTLGVQGFSAASASPDAVSIGVVTPMPTPGVQRVPMRRTLRKPVSRTRLPASRAGSRRSGAWSASGKAVAKGRTATAKAQSRAPQDFLSKLSKATLAPGVVYYCHRGPLNVNILDVDLKEPGLEVKPVLAGDSFNRLDEVKDQAEKVNAIAAVNANYFKQDGTPLGTLVMDGEWLAGPLYDRISFGLTENKQVYLDRANLHGVMETSNPAVSNVWVNNINQPRRSGAKLIVYSRRWGPFVKMAYAGCLVSVDSSGRVLDKSSQSISIPYGGFVLSDKKGASISKLNRGDLVFLDWQHKPDRWSQVVQAVSGGPCLMRNGKLYLDLKDEHFRKTWTSSSIHARTALGVTSDKHLILATVEGPHTLWDLAKMLQKLGCVEAMNLDGGGSTTMVVRGKIVTRNKNSYQRRVAVSLAVLPKSANASIAERKFGTYVPQTDLTSLTAGNASALDQSAGTARNSSSGAPENPSAGADKGLEKVLSLLPIAPALADPLADRINWRILEEPLPASAEPASGESGQVGEPTSTQFESGRKGKRSKRSKDRSKSKDNSKDKAFGWMKKLKF